MIPIEGNFSGVFDKLSGQCSSEDTYEGMETNNVLLQEFACATDNQFDLPTGACTSASCTAGCVNTSQFSLGFKKLFLILFSRCHQQFHIF